MQCKVDITSDSDIAAWVSKNMFMKYVDLMDISLRESQKVFDWYHPLWFRQSSSGELCFTPPAFTFSDGCLRGINGRHRAVLLCRHLDPIPMLLVNPHTWPKSIIKKIVQREINANEVLELPALALNEALIENEDPDDTITVSNFNIEINLCY